VSTNEDGHFLFWVDDTEYRPGQRFKITLSHADFEDKSYDDIEIIPSRILNVGRYATGDGTTDDSTAIASAITALGGQGTLYFPIGDYNLGTTGITLNGSIRFIGEGAANETSETLGSRLIYTGTGAAITVNDGSGTDTHAFEIANMSLEGSDTGAYGIKLGASSGSPKAAVGLLRNLYISGFATGGLWAVSSQMVRLERVHCSRNTGDGVIVDLVSGGANTVTTFADCRFSNNTGRGVYIKGGTRLSFRDCVCELNGLEGVLIEKTTGTDIKSIIFDGHYTAANNNGRVGTGYAQFKTFSNDTTYTIDVSLRDPTFSAAGTDNYHISLAGVHAHILYPYFTNPASGGELPDPDTSETRLAFWDYDTPVGAWTIANDAKVNAVFHHLDEAEHTIYTASSGAITEVFALTKDLYLKDGDLYIRNSSDDVAQIHVGQEGNHRGVVSVYGENTGQNQGGEFVAYVADDFDTTINNFRFSVEQDDLNIGPNTDQDALKYDGANNRWETTVPLVATGGIRVKHSDNDVSNPPTNAEMVTAFGAAATVGEGFIGVIDDNNAHTNVYLVVSDGTKYWQATLTAGA
jgi:hypothetical protein